MLPITYSELRDRVGLLFAGHESGIGIEKQLMRAALQEVEHVQQRTGDCIARTIADARKFPVVLDEAENRGLIGDRAIDEIDLGIWRDQQERLAGTIAATSILNYAIHGLWSSAAAWASKVVVGDVRLADDGTHLVVVPSVRVVVEDEHCGRLPVG